MREAFERSNPTGAGEVPPPPSPQAAPDGSPTDRERGGNRSGVDPDAGQSDARSPDRARANDCPDPGLLATARNILDLPPEELTAYRAELEHALPDDPNLAHDRAALALAEALRGPEAA